MTSKKSFFGPVAIGASPGSGTRLVASLIRDLGIFLGPYLNRMLDNLWFTYLFRTRIWLEKNSPADRRDVSRLLDGFKQAMVDGNVSKSEIFPLLTRLGKDHLAQGIEFSRFVKAGKWTAKSVYTFLTSQGINHSDYVGWGWKEPHTLFYLQSIAEKFDNLKYIHVIRNGLDMAFKPNTEQLNLLGSLFDVELPSQSKEIPRALLKFWFRTNRFAIEEAQRWIKDRFLILKFEDLCFSPAKEIQRILDFLGLEISLNKFDQLVSVPKIPESIGRYKKHDLSIFSKEELHLVEDLESLITKY